MLKVYLSSSFSAYDSGAGPLMEMRADLRVRGEKLGIDVVLAEHDPAVVAAVASNNHIGILEGCARLIGASDALFGVVFERHGTGVLLSEDPILVRSDVSFFEAELLAACFKRIPAFVVHAREAPPGQRMQDFLHLVSATMGNDLVEIERPAIPHQFDDFCRALLKREVHHCPWLIDPLSLARIWRGRHRETQQAKLGFLGDVFRADGDGDCDETVLKLALNRAQQPLDEGGTAIGHMARLSHLWIAVRELVHAPVSTRMNELNAEFQMAMSAWNNSAAWHGLHGAHPMGCLAALNELDRARRIQGESAPHIPRASAYYSVAGLAAHRAAKSRFYRQSLDLCQRALLAPDSNPIAVRQQRASVQARLATLSAVDRWRYFAALDDYKFAFDQRTKEHAPGQDVGMALTEYAYALFQQPWRRQEALRLMAEGMGLLSSDTGYGASGFYFRAARKYGELLFSNRQLDFAHVVVSEALAAAKKVEATDQARQLESLVARIAKRLHRPEP